MGLLTFLAIVVLFLIIIYFIFSKELQAALERDPAARGKVQILLLYPGVHAIIGYRITHWIWKKKLKFIARAISQLVRLFTGVEIHPGATIDKGLFIDHGHGVVIGETTIIGQNVTLFQNVTLGGTGKETGKRHPTIGDNVVVGAGAKVLGNIEIGSNTYVGANAVVIKSVPTNATVVGVPGHITKQDGKRIDKLLDHVHINDPMMQNVVSLLKRIKALEEGQKEEQDGAGI